MSLLPRPEQGTPAAAPTVKRRSLFAGATAVGAAAAVAVLLPSSPDVAEVQAAKEPAVPPQRGGGYALTERVKQYYQTARV